MGFLAGFSKGGFLNDVDVTFNGYKFTAIPPGGGKKKSEWVYLVPSLRVDGADEDVTTHLFGGALESFEISDDGLMLTPNDGVRFSLNTPMGIFLSSLIERGFPESELPDIEGGEPLHLNAVVGRRLRVGQQVNEKSTAKAGKRKDKKTGREYDRTDTIVTKVYDEEGKTTGKGGGHPTSASSATKRLITAPAMTFRSSSSKPAGKPNGELQDEPLTDMADELLLEILGDKNGEIKRKSVSIEITKRRMKDANRDALREMIYSDEYLTDAAERGIITFNQKTQTITAA